jgi:hypothetical protein
MLRVSSVFSSRDQENERTVMGNVAVGEALAGLDELKDLYELNASEPEDEGEYDEKEDDDEDEDDEEFE